MIKVIWGTLIIALCWFLYLMFTPQYAYPGQFHFAYVQEGYEKYESTFDPHKTFEDWPLLHSNLSSTTFLCIVGNPKIQWNETNRDTDQPIPNGELASQLVYIFQPRPDDLFELVMYMYKDKDNYIIAYVWDPIRKSYRKLTNNI